MQRRVAMAVAVAATTSFAVGVVAFGAVGGARIFGFNGPSAPVGPRSEMIVEHRTETVDQVVVVAPTVPGADAAIRPSNLAALVDAGGHALAGSSPISSVRTVTSDSATPASSVLLAPNLVVQGADTTGAVVGTSSSSTSSGAAGQPRFQSATSPAGVQAPPKPRPTDAAITPSTTSASLVTATTSTTATTPSTASPTPSPTLLTTATPDIKAVPATTAEPGTTEGRDTSEAPPTTELRVTSVPPSTTTSPSATTTSGVPESGPTPTARPRGVPADWPAGKPIPPMPPGCQDPQLEDNGIWNCDH